MKASVIIIAILFYCIFSSGGFEPNGVCHIPTEYVDSIAIVDRQDIKNNVIETVDHYDLYRLKLPLVAIKNEVLESRLRDMFRNHDNIKIVYLIQYELSRKEKTKDKRYFCELWPISPSGASINVSKSSIGYVQLDSAFVIFDRSARSVIKKIKGMNKEFNIEMPVYKYLFLIDPICLYY